MHGAVVGPRFWSTSSSVRRTANPHRESSVPARPPWNQIPRLSRSEAHQGGSTRMLKPAASRGSTPLCLQSASADFGRLSRGIRMCLALHPTISVMPAKAGIQGRLGGASIGHGFPLSSVSVFSRTTLAAGEQQQRRRMKSESQNREASGPARPPWNQIPRLSRSGAHQWGSIRTWKSAPSKGCLQSASADLCPLSRGISFPGGRAGSSQHINRHSVSRE